MSHTTTLALAAGLALSLVSSAHAQSNTLHQVEWSGQTFRPVRVATYDSTTREIGPWRSVSTFTARGDCTQAVIYDAFEGDWQDDNGDGDIFEPIGGDDPSDCGAMFNQPGPDSRWHFGTNYCNTFVVADFDLTVNAGVSPDPRRGSAQTIALAIQTCGDDGQGPFCGSDCPVGDPPLYLIVETHEDFAQPPASPGSEPALSGYVFDFGTPSTECGGYHIFLADLCGLGADAFQLPFDAQGALSVQMVQTIEDTDGDGVIDLIESSDCGRPMLWGTGNNEAQVSGDGQPDTTRPGDETRFQWDDDGPRDGHHDPSAEFYEYAMALCPDPLGAMYAMLGSRCSLSLADWNASTVLNTADVIAYLGDYNAVAGGQPFTYADPDLAPPFGGGASTLNTADLIAYLDTFGACSQ